MGYLKVDKAYIAQDLKSHVIEIIWDHPEGGRRVVKGTLMKTFLPEEFHGEQQMNQLIHSVDQETVPVLDVIQNRLFPLSLKQIVSAQIINF